MHATAIVASQNPVVTLNDVAVKAGVSRGAAARCLGKNAGAMSAQTVAKVKQAAAELQYNPEAARHHRGPVKTPANSVFASRADETAAMLKLRKEGHSNMEIAHRCGVDHLTVYRRIGTQPKAITVANVRLAAKMRSAKSKIHKAYAQQQAVAQYNELAAQLNAQLEAAQKMAAQLSSMQKSAVKASKATGTPLLRLLPPTNIS